MIVGPDDLKGLFQSKLFYDSYMVQQFPGGEKKKKKVATSVH